MKTDYVYTYARHAHASDDERSFFRMSHYNIIWDNIQDTIIRIYLHILTTMDDLVRGQND